MYKRIIIIVAMLALLGSLVSPANAEVPTTYESSVQIRNLTTTAGTVTLSFYLDNGTVALPSGTASFPITANESLSFYRSSMPVAAGFNGSMVISSDVELAGMSNLVGLNTTGKGVSYGAYRAFSSGATKVYLPTLQANNSGYNSFYSVQNLGTGLATVTVAYTDGVTRADLSIPVSASQKVNQSSEGHTATVFGGILSSDQPIAVTVSIVGNTLFVYNGISNLDQAPIMPLINTNNSGYVTGVQIMNTGATTSDVTITYKPSVAGTECWEKRTVGAGASKTYAYYGFFRPETTDLTYSSNCVLGQRFIGSATVTTNSGSQPLAIVVNQLHPTDNKGGAYGGFAQVDSGSKIIFPLIMDRNSGYYTSWSLTNIGTTEIAANAITCTVTGKDKVGTVVTKDFKNPTAIAPMQGWTQSHSDQIALGFVGGATCVAPVGSKVVGIANELGSGATFTGIDSLLVYEGIAR